MVKQERAARTRESLVRAAAEAFTDEGFATASISGISGRAGVTSGALHFHFSGKDELARTVEGRAAAALRVVTRTAGEPGGRAGNPLTLLVDSTYTLMALLAGDVVVRAGFALSADVTHRSQVDLREQLRVWTGELIEAAGRQGLLAEGVSPQQATPAVVASIVGLEVLGAADPGWFAADTLTRIWSVLMPVIAADRAEGGTEGRETD
ncbi:ScbR family autoregulator-binding transcription factor [Streptomyces sp. NPDC054904]|uniref:ScbR family autoregulator-binding transcription factor n=1 Tax=unclassified Streptomyces TaxID=2593676 RepID=UPI002481D055|nr:ScbR family autoregulator-binding transcription factor [Streptomyces sp. Isolate_45]MDA5283756.1 ScbR family autoregulator-binding transcription factor [Streptomyces sp. Isolate_45]